MFWLARRLYIRLVSICLVLLLTCELVWMGARECVCARDFGRAFPEGMPVRRQLRGSSLLLSFSFNVGSRGGTQIARVLQQALLPAEPSFWSGPAVTTRGNSTSNRTGQR